MRLKNYIINHIVNYPTPILNYTGTFGSLLAFLLSLQIISGLFIACYYIPKDIYALKSILFLIQEVKGGWLSYRLHVMCSNLIFIILYLHLFRGFYYRLYTWENRFSW